MVAGDVIENTENNQNNVDQKKVDAKKQIEALKRREEELRREIKSKIKNIPSQKQTVCGRRTVHLLFLQIFFV